MMPSCHPAGSNAWKTSVDEFGRKWHAGFFIGCVVDSMQALRTYSPSPSDANDFFPEQRINLVNKNFPDHCLIWGTHIGPMTASYMAMGFIPFFTALSENPSFVQTVLETRTDWCIAMYTNAQERGAEILILGDDVGTSQGPMISPTMWREFIYPHHKRIVEALDVPVIWHSDGDVTSLLCMAIEAGFTGYHGVDVIAGLNLRKVKQEYGKDLILIGNVDTRILFNDNLNAVRDEVTRCVVEGAPEGGYMFASCNSICEGMNPLMVAEMYRYVDTIGSY
jgi:uroporphyrinogen decarboxylase